MTITEAQACKARGMSREAILQSLTAARDAQLRADESLVAHVWRPAYPSETCQRPMTAYDYNNR